MAKRGANEAIKVFGSLAQSTRLEIYRRLASRIFAFVNLPFGDLDLAPLKESIAEVGRMEGARELTLNGIAPA